MSTSPCQPSDTKCWCSVAAALPSSAVNLGPWVSLGCSLETAATPALGAANNPTTLATSTSSPSTSPNTPTATANSPTSPSLPTSTTTSSLSDDSNRSGSRSSSFHSQHLSAASSTSASALADESATSSLAPTSAVSVTVTLLLPSSASPLPSDPHPLSIGTIVAIALSALAVLLASALALFFLCRRGSRSSRSRRTSIGSSQRRLQPHIYGGRSSRRVSSVWTGFGSVSVDPDFDPRPDLSRHSESASLGFPFAEKAGSEDGRSEAYTPGTYPSPASGEARPLARDASVHSLHEAVAAHYLGVHIQPPSALQDLSSSETLALPGADNVAANSVRNNGERVDW